MSECPNGSDSDIDIDALIAMSSDDGEEESAVSKTDPSRDSDEEDVARFIFRGTKKRPNPEEIQDSKYKPKIAKVEREEPVRCLLCDRKPKKSLSDHLWKTHKVTLGRYTKVVKLEDNSSPEFPSTGNLAAELVKRASELRGKLTSMSTDFNLSS